MIWAFCIFWPIALSLVVHWFSSNRHLTSLVLAIAPLPALLGALGALTPQTASIPSLLLGADFGLDSIRAPILAATALLWSLAGWICGSYPLRQEAKKLFLVLFLLTLAGNIGLLVANDIITFYCCFALMTFSAIGLIVHGGDERAHAAARVYVVLAVFGEILLLAAIFLTVFEAGHLRLEGLREAVADSGRRHWIVGLTLAGFGVKLGWVPFHFWLPLAHPVAPTPASAVLSGAMIKAGLIGWLHLLPLGVSEMAVWGHLLIAMGAISALGAVAVGLTQRDPKVILAYSSISQMGIVSVFIGLTLLRPELWAVATPFLTLFVIQHTLAKGSLFLGTAISPGTKVGRMARTFGMTVPALVLAGAPATSGLLAKSGLKELAEDSVAPWPLILPDILLASSFATALLLGRLVWLLHRQAATDQPHGSQWWLPWLLSVSASGGLMLFLAGQSNFSLPSPKIDVTSLPMDLLPLAAAAVVLWFWFKRKQLQWRATPIPAGDLLVLCLLPGDRLRQAWQRLQQSDRKVMTITALSDRIIAFEEGRALVDRLERQLGRWPWIGLLAGLGTIAFFLTLWL